MKNALSFQRFFLIISLPRFQTKEGLASQMEDHTTNSSTKAHQKQQDSTQSLATDGTAVRDFTKMAAGELGEATHKRKAGKDTAPHSKKPTKESHDNG